MPASGRRQCCSVPGAGSAAPQQGGQETNRPVVQEAGDTQRGSQATKGEEKLKRALWAASGAAWSGAMLGRGLRTGESKAGTKKLGQLRAKGPAAPAEWPEGSNTHLFN